MDRYSKAVKYYEENGLDGIVNDWAMPNPNDHSCLFLFLTKNGKKNPYSFSYCPSITKQSINDGISAGKINSKIIEFIKKQKFPDYVDETIEIKDLRIFAKIQRFTDKILNRKFEKYEN